MWSRIKEERGMEGCEEESDIKLKFSFPNVFYIRNINTGTVYRIAMTVN